MAKKNDTIFKLFGVASVMGLHMISGPLAGGGLGWLIDYFLDTKPYGLGIGIILGIVAGYMNVMEDSKTLQREQESLKKENLENKVSEGEKSLEKTKNTEYIEYGLFGDGKKKDFNEEKTSL